MSVFGSFVHLFGSCNHSTRNHIHPPSNDLGSTDGLWLKLMRKSLDGSNVVYRLESKKPSELLTLKALLIWLLDLGSNQGPTD
jgi:hypothetical protein